MKRELFPTLLMVEWLKGSRVRLFFASGKVSEVDLPTSSAKKSKIVYGGVGLDIDGKGYEMSASTLHEMPGKVWAAAYGRKAS